MFCLGALQAVYVYVCTASHGSHCLRQLLLGRCRACTVAMLVVSLHLVHTAMSAMSVQRDVPGITRAVLAAFQQVAMWTSTRVRAISVGVNSASAPPDVPQNEPFIWRDEASDSGTVPKHSHVPLKPNVT